MPDIINLELNPSNGAVKTLGPLTVNVSEKNAIKQEENNEPLASSESEVSGAENKGTGTDETSQAKPLAENKESFQKTETPNLENDPKFQAIAKREREFRTRETQVKQMLARRENELNARLSKFEADYQEKVAAVEAFSKLAESAKRNPEPYLRHVFGDNWYENAVQFKLNGRPVPELVQEQIETKLSAEIRTLREERERERQELKREQERQRQSYLQQEDKENQELIDSFNRQTEDYIRSKPETFELIHMQGKTAFNLVNQLREAEYVQNGKFITAQEAAERVENFLTEQVKSYSKAKKFGQSESKKETTSQTSDNRSIEQKLEVIDTLNKGARTLTNQMTVSTPSVMTQSRTEQDRIKRALAAMDSVRKAKM